MKKILLLVFLLPAIGFGQSKKKLRQTKEKADAVLEKNLISHVKYLADDKLEGRRAGSKGESLAVDYLIKNYTALGLEPKGTEGFVQPFTVNEGKQIDSISSFQLHEHKLIVGKDFFPLAFSASSTVHGKPAMALTESGQPWFVDLNELLEENKSNPHFEIMEEIKKINSKAVSKGATALFLYNSGDKIDNVLFNKNDTTTELTIPVLYIAKQAINQYFKDEAATLEVAVTISISKKVRTAKNVVGYINNHAANTVILGAHLDHLGYGQDKNALDTGNAIRNGADDNASGTAALMELTRLLKINAPSNNNYLIIHFSAEELGLFGSKHWLEYPTINLNPNYMINMDMVGRYDTAHKLTIGGYGTSPVWGTILPTVTNNLMVKWDSSGSGPSDHASFYRKEIPVLFFFTGSHIDYHKATDDWDKINFQGIKQVVNMVYETIQATDSKGKIAFTKTREAQTGRSSGFKVSLGVIPDYGFTGTGMRIDGVSPGKLASKIGLAAGDILLQLGAYQFVDVNSYMQSLGKFNKGDKTCLKIKRGTDEITFNIEF